MGRQQAAHRAGADGLQVFQECPDMERVATAASHLLEPACLGTDSHHGMGSVARRRQGLESACYSLWRHHDTALRQGQYAAEGQTTV